MCLNIETEASFDAPYPYGPLPSLRPLFTQVVLDRNAIEGVQSFGQRQSIPVILLERITESDLDRFVRQNSVKAEFIKTLRAMVDNPYFQGASGEPGSPERRYNVDYGSASFLPFQSLLTSLDGQNTTKKEALLRCFAKFPNYSFASPLFSLSIYAITKIMNYATLTQVREQFNRGSDLVLDVGCGSGELLNFLANEMWISRNRLLGIDISKASQALLKLNGIRAETGTLPQIVDNGYIAPGTVDFLFLSYFIDRDTNQAGTFDAASACVKAGGHVILEGLFPVNMRDSLGIDYSGKGRITPGKTAAEDIACISEYLSSRQLELQRIVLGERLVHSLDGLEILSSTFLVFKKRD